MENHPSNGRKAMEEELIKGCDLTNQLLEILVSKSNTTHHEGVEEEGLLLPFAEDLVRKVLRSFTNTLLLLNTQSDVSDKVVIPPTPKDISSSVKCPKFDDKDKATCKVFINAKRRRGCYKRKLSSPTWEKNSSILTEDGYVWRKYGQKITMHAKYLRSYYRCTHKYDQGCPATKQVQRTQEDPPLYRTTYYGHHNCKSPLSPDILFESASYSDSSVFLSFSNTFPNKEEYPFSSPLSSCTKEEHKEVILDDHIIHNQLLSPNYHLSCDYGLDFKYSRHDNMPSSTESVQLDEVYGSGQEFDG